MINPFELIGFDYGSGYVWQDEPLLFDINSTRIPNNLYRRTRRDLVITDQNHLSNPNNQLKNFIYNLTDHDLMEYVNNHMAGNDVVFYGNNNAYIVDANELLEAINRPTRFIRVTGRLAFILNQPRQSGLQNNIIPLEQQRRTSPNRPQRHSHGHCNRV
ncbi:MAG: hypothetical protein KKE11_00770 [Gammaproteobacteria bacterium]|nr:hypothetical protein [Gammaproteobacteria bacterium]